MASSFPPPPVSSLLRLHPAGVLTFVRPRESHSALFRRAFPRRAFLAIFTFRPQRRSRFARDSFKRHPRGNGRGNERVDSGKAFYLRREIRLLNSSVLQRDLPAKYVCYTAANRRAGICVRGRLGDRDENSERTNSRRFRRSAVDLRFNSPGKVKSRGRNVRLIKRVSLKGRAVTAEMRVDVVKLPGEIRKRSHLEIRSVARARAPEIQLQPRDW